MPVFELNGFNMIELDRPIRKADLVKADILAQLAEAKVSEDHDEVTLLETELAYLEAHRSEY